MKKANEINEILTELRLRKLLVVPLGTYLRRCALAPAGRSLRAVLRMGFGLPSQVMP